MKIKGAIFDMDGTLIDSLMFWGEAWRTIGRKFMGLDGYTPPESVDRAVRTMIYTDALRYMRDELKLSVPEDEFVSFGKTLLSDFYETTAKVKPGAFELLDHLRAKGIKMCVASATNSEYVKRALAHHRLIDYFDSVHSCSELGVGKDKPDVYLKAIDSLGLSPEEVCVFEDSYVAIETARAIGCRTAGLYDRYNFGQDRLRDFSDVYMREGEDLTVLIGAF